MLISTQQGLYCPAGGFHIDPKDSVPKALITHAHGDHARSGSALYYVQAKAVDILRYRLGAVPVQAVAYGEKMKLGSVWVSFHPAGHILGSSQIKIESSSQVVVVSGDYKRAVDATCDAFEPLECDLFVTESTFALPIYKWDDSSSIVRDIFKWWQQNADQGHPSLLFCYALGKAQRVISLLKNLTDREIYVHGTIQPINALYEQQGVSLLKTKVVTRVDSAEDYSKALILAPLSAYRSPWMRRFKNVRTAFASGWMAVRGTRRRQGFDSGFALSDHADWDGLLMTIKQTRAKKIWVTHGESEVLSRYLSEVEHLDAEPLPGVFGERED